MTREANGDVYMWETTQGTYVPLLDRWQGVQLTEEEKAKLAAETAKLTGAADDAKKKKKGGGFFGGGKKGKDEESTALVAAEGVEGARPRAEAVADLFLDPGQLRAPDHVAHGR